MQHNKRKLKGKSGNPPKIPKISVSEDKKEGVVKLTKQLTGKGSDKTGGGKNIGTDSKKILNGNNAPSMIKILTKNDKPNVGVHNKQDDKISKNMENKTESKFAKKRLHPTKYTKITSKQISRKVSGVKFNGSNNDKSHQRETNKIKNNTSVKKRSLEPKNVDSDKLNSESPEKMTKMVFDKQGKKRKWRDQNDRTAQFYSRETESKGNTFKTQDYNVNRHIKYDAETRQNKTPLTDRQKHKRWKLRQKRALKNAQLKDTNIDEEPLTADVSETVLVKESKPKFEKFVLPKSHDDASLNWKKLQSVLEAKKSDSEGGKKKQRPRPVKYSTNRHRKKDEIKPKAGETEKPVETSAPEIWFDDVDEILLEPSHRIKPPASVATDNRTDHLDHDPGKTESVKKNPLVKPEAFKGLTKVVGMDCEMVGVGDGEENMLARVSIVNQYGEMVYDKFVKPMEDVVDYRTHVSGVRKHDLESGMEFSQVQKDVAEILKGRLLVGHALENDLKVLFLDHPKRRIRDTSRYKPFRQLFQGRTPSLKKLTAHILGVQVQEGEHNSVQDAQAAMRLYTQYRQQWEGELRKVRQRPGDKGKKSVQKDSVLMNIPPVDTNKDKHVSYQQKHRKVLSKRRK